MLTELELARIDFLRAQFLERGDDRPVDMAGAVRLYRRAALRGLADAQHALGCLHLAGRGVAPNAALAMAWLERAAEQEHSAAQHNLGVLYLEGRGVEGDRRKAMYWLNRAALNGSLISRQFISGARSHVDDGVAVES